MPTTEAPNRPPQAATEIATVRGELTRADTQATALIAITTAVLTALLAAQAVELPHPVKWVLGVAALATAAAIVLLALVLYPDLGDGRSGWLGYADLTPEQVQARLTTVDQALIHARQLSHLARIGRRKFRRTRAAVWLLLAVVGLAVAAGGLNWAIMAGR